MVLTPSPWEELQVPLFMVRLEVTPLISKEHRAAFMSIWVPMPTAVQGLALSTPSTLIGGAANDTFNFGVGGVHSSTSIVGGAGADTFSTSAAFTDSTLLGGAGNDTPLSSPVYSTPVRLTAVLVSP